MKIETRAIKSLTPDPQNARTHSQRNLDAIKTSLDKFGQRKPIVITPEGVVLAGNGTLEAAKALGWSEITVALTPADWDYATAKAYALADNRSAELAEWDTSVLASQLVELDAEGWDIGELGFDVPEQETDTTLEDDGEPLSFDNVPTRASLGDHWTVGNHHIICGDSMNPETIARFKTQFDAVITDPPYGIGANKQTMGAGKKNFHRGDGWDKEAPDITFLLAYAPTQIIWGGNYFTDALPPTNDWLCWHKKNDGRSFSEFELAWTNLGKQARLLAHHWGGEEKQHVTMKPSAVMDWCVSFVDSGAKILDVFAGSGSTLLAADRNNQTGYGVELDPRYVDVILDRLEKQTGLTAELVNEPA